MDSVIPRERLATELTKLVKRYGASGAYLFGSYARNAATAASDIDVLVVGGSGFKPTNVFAIAEELYRTFGKRVDVYEEQEIDKDSPLYRSIMEDRVLVA